MTGVIRGFVAFFRASGFLFQKRLAWVYLVPLALYLVLMTAGTVAFSTLLYGAFEIPLYRLIGTNAEMLATNNAGKWYELAFKLIHFSEAVAISILVFYLSSRTMKYAILIVCSPLLAWVSEKTESLKTGKEYPFSLPQFASDVLRSVLLNCRNFLLESLLVIAGLILTLFFPPAALVFTALMFVVNCYFMGFSMFDYIAERQKLGFRESIRTMRQHRGMLTGLGLAFNLVSLIPFADWAIAPVNGAVGAVLAEEGRFNGMTSAPLV